VEEKQRRPLAELGSVDGPVGKKPVHVRSFLNFVGRWYAVEAPIDKSTVREFKHLALDVKYHD
jgi:hypothetical protein